MSESLNKKGRGQKIRQVKKWAQVLTTWGVSLWREHVTDCLTHKIRYVLIGTDYLMEEKRVE